MNPVPYNLTRLLAQEEGQYFERKSLWDGRPGEKSPRTRRIVRDEIAEYVVANADGGVLALGVEDDGALTGHGYPDEAVEEFLSVPQQRLNPPQPPGVRLRHGEGEVLVFDVQSALRAVMVVGNGFPRRCNDRIIRESEDVINAIKNRNRRDSYEEEPCPGVLFEDLDEQLIRKAAESAGLGNGPEAYLIARRLADRRRADLVLRRGAVLLFARGVIDHPNAGLRIFRVDGTERLTGARHNVQELPRIEGALPRVIEQAHRTLSGLIRTSTRLHDLFFRETPEYPTFAWQEAVVNAIAHRDYRIQGACAEVWLFNNRMEVHSPGGLLPEVELRRLERRERIHLSRNPRMTRVLAELAIMREQGEGIPRIFEEMEASWLPLPELASDAFRFILTLRNRPIFEARDSEWLAFVRSLSLNNRQKRILVAFQGNSFASADYQRLNRVDRDTAYREMREMAAQGVLDGPDRPGRGARYQVTPGRSVDIERRRKFGAQTLVEKMGTNGYVTNADYRACFGVSSQQAKRELTDLVQKNILRLVGRGRNAHYVSEAGWSVWADAAQLSH